MSQPYFLSALFEPDEQTCFATSVYQTEVFYAFWEGPVKADLFFSINPMHSSRADHHVTRHRNILLEFDDGSPSDQLNHLTDVPHTTLVWSGGKSHHAVISLEEPCWDREEYDAIVRRIYKKLPMVDQSVKNPSRLSRLPGVMRDNGNLQSLVHVKNRVGRETIEAWLGPEPEKAKTEQPKLRSLHLSPWTKYFLMYGSEPGKRNADLFKAACDMLRHGYNAETICERASEVLDLDRREIMNTVKSANDAVRRGQ